MKIFNIKLIGFILVNLSQNLKSEDEKKEIFFPNNNSKIIIKVNNIYLTEHELCFLQENKNLFELNDDDLKITFIEKLLTIYFYIKYNYSTNYVNEILDSINFIPQVNKEVPDRILLIVKLLKQKDSFFKNLDAILNEEKNNLKEEILCYRYTIIKGSYKNKKPQKKQLLYLLESNIYKDIFLENKNFYDLSIHYVNNDQNISNTYNEKQKKFSVVVQKIKVYKNTFFTLQIWSIEDENKIDTAFEIINNNLCYLNKIDFLNNLLNRKQIKHNYNIQTMSENMLPQDLVCLLHSQVLNKPFVVNNYIIVVVKKIDNPMMFKIDNEYSLKKFITFIHKTNNFEKIKKNLIKQIESKYGK